VSCIARAGWCAENSALRNCEVVLDLRAIGELIAEPRKDVGDALKRARNRMQVADAVARPGRLTSMLSVARRFANASSSRLPCVP